MIDIFNNFSITIVLNNIDHNIVETWTYSVIYWTKSVATALFPNLNFSWKKHQIENSHYSRFFQLIFKESTYIQLHNLIRFILYKVHTLL